MTDDPRAELREKAAGCKDVCLPTDLAYYGHDREGRELRTCRVCGKKWRTLA
jgi:hypothetical protein